MRTSTKNVPIAGMIARVLRVIALDGTASKPRGDRYFRFPSARAAMTPSPM
ncbi:MAG: hypothetical protein ACREMB_15715 [Candidatus Rokuibacteriota bacterium]